MDGIGWHFPESEAATRDGFNASAIDIFRSEPLQALVREAIQNSLDARVDSNEPVVVRFTLTEVSDLDTTGFSELAKYFKAGEELEKSDEGRTFYRHAIRQVDDGVVKFLGVHDYNTTGLTGPTFDPPSNPATGPWLALVKGSGMTYKRSASALGSFGHGSRAPFAMSELRTIFYLSRIQKGGELETRFQGKSILQSLPLNGIIPGQDAWCAATGYFGIRKGCLPLTGDTVPTWATDARDESGTGPSVGTSILIPEPYGVENVELLWDKVKLAVVANFYYAVLTSNLVVHLANQEVLDAKTIEGAFDEVVDRTELTPTDKVLDRMQSARTVRYAEDSGVEDISGVGRIDWYVRLDGAEGRKVGVARGSGMLITRAAEKLQRFHGVRPFDLFVCVVGEEGSRMLRKLENPEHTEFSLDRIGEATERKNSAEAYGKFTDKIRELVQRVAALVVQDEETIDDLDDFFRSEANPGAECSSGEPARALRIAARRARRYRDNRPTPLTGEGSETQGHGLRGGNGTRKSRGGSIPGEGEGVTSAGSRTGLPVRDLRIVRKDRASGVALVLFTPIDSSRRRFVLLRSGDHETARLRFRTPKDIEFNSEPRDHVDLSELSPGSRKKLRLVFDPADLEFAIEGRLEP